MPVVSSLERLNSRVGGKDIHLPINWDLLLNYLDSKNPDAKTNQTETSLITALKRRRKKTLYRPQASAGWVWVKTVIIWSDSH